MVVVMMIILFDVNDWFIEKAGNVICLFHAADVSWPIWNVLWNTRECIRIKRCRRVWTCYSFLFSTDLSLLKLLLLSIKKSLQTTLHGINWSRQDVSARLSFWRRGSVCDDGVPSWISAKLHKGWLSGFQRSLHRSFLIVWLVQWV